MNSFFFNTSKAQAVKTLNSVLSSSSNNLFEMFSTIKVSNNTHQNFRLGLTKVLGIVQKHIVFYPTSTSISYFYGFGATAGLFLAIQLVTGIILAMHYQPSATMAFESVLRIVNDVPYGWLLRSLHATGASFFFIAVYIHMGRGLYYGSLFGPRTWVWITGLVIFLLMMGAGFIGYCLPWGQMSLWGATVITNLLSVLIWPLDITVVEWLWGGFTVTGITLNRFFSLHYLLPFVILALVIAHLYFLHDVSSNNPQGLESYLELGKVPFYSYFTLKDLAGFFLFVTCYFIIVFFYPTLLGHSDNFIKANPFVTPAHIVPEWYFLPFYAILRSISNKLAGVLAMLVASAFISIVYFSSIIFKQWIFDTEIKRNIADLPISKILFWFFIFNFFLLGYIGARPIEEPYYLVGQVAALFFFAYWFLLPFVMAVENIVLHNILKKKLIYVFFYIK
jgi:ubiquinol-cytochrome c reductase cytochrome b/c1 subunit